MLAVDRAGNILRLATVNQLKFVGQLGSFEYLE
jgi:hypothetical protein